MYIYMCNLLVQIIILINKYTVSYSTKYTLH